MGHVPYGNSACVSIRVLCQFVYSQPQSSHHLLRQNLQCFELCRDDLVAVAVLAPHIRAETLQILPMARRRVHGTESLRIVGISPATTSYLFLCACPVPASMRNPLSAVFEAMSSVVITFSAAPPIVRVASSGLSWVATERSGIWIVNRSSDPGTTATPTRNRERGRKRTASDRMVKKSSTSCTRPIGFWLVISGWDESLDVVLTGVAAVDVALESREGPHRRDSCHSSK